MYAATNGTYTLFLSCEDNDPSNPRKDYEPFGRMICWHSRYNIGDNHEYAEPIDFLRDLYVYLLDTPGYVFNYVKQGLSQYVRLEYDNQNCQWHLKEPSSFGGETHWYTTNVYNEFMQNSRISDDAFYDIVHALGIKDLMALLTHIKGFILLPLYLYDHSGITISTSPFSCPWDSGQVGWIYCTPERLQAEFGNITETNMKQANRLMEEEIKVYDTYLRGECYGYCLYLGMREIDSCWGFFGEIENIKNDLRAEMPFEIIELVDSLEYTNESKSSYLLYHVKEM